jgi:trans-2,3-dihydro-3-hydroxyanthranilate isomerase
VIVPLRGLDALGRARVAEEEWLTVTRETEAKAALLFCREARSPASDLSARVFAGHYGVPEDPATGSANGCLAAYLVKYRCLGTPRIDLRVEQGYEMGRPSLLRLRAVRTEAAMEVRVGGRVIMVAKGELF